MHTGKEKTKGNQLGQPASGIIKKPEKERETKGWTGWDFNRILFTRIIKSWTSRLVLVKGAGG